MVSCKTNKITVVHLIGSLRIGGAERQLLSLAPFFDTERFRTIVCTMEPDGPLTDTLRESGVDVRALNFRMRHFASGVRRLVKLLKQEKVDVLHMHMYHAAWYGRIAGLCAHVPVMITTDHGQELWKKPWDVAFERYMNKHTAMRIAVSRDVADILRTRERVPEEKLLVLLNGVDVERFRPNKAERDAVRSELGFVDDIVVVGTVARLVDPKALHILIKAVALARKAVPQMKLVLIGDGPLRGDLERCASEQGVSDIVTFAGMRSDIPAVLAAMDIFCLSSKSEGLPVSLLEAMAAERTIVSTRVGGIPEVLTDHREGLLVEPNDPDALADALQEVACNSELAAGLARKASEKVAAEYSNRAVVRKLEEIYGGLLNKAQRC